MSSGTRGRYKKRKNNELDYPRKAPCGRKCFTALPSPPTPTLRFVRATRSRTSCNRRTYVVPHLDVRLVDGHEPPSYISTECSVDLRTDNPNGRKASSGNAFTGRARLLPSQSQARQEPRSPTRSKSPSSILQDC